MRKKSAILAFLLVSVGMLSNVCHSAEQWLNTKVLAVYPQANGDFVLVFHDNHPNCTAPQSNQYFSVAVGANGVTENGRDNLLATALAAAASKSDVSVAFDDSTSNCYINRIWAEIGK